MKFNEAFEGRNYLHSLDILGEPLTTMVLHVDKVELDNHKGTKETKPVVTIHGGKPFVLNVTNYTRLSRIAKSADTANWKGIIFTVEAIDYPRAESGYALRVVNRPIKTEAFLEAATDVEDLKERYALLNDTSYKNIVIKISKQWIKK